MSKTFREWTLDQALLLPPSVHDFVPAGHLSRFVVALVTEELDLSTIMASYKGEKGQPPCHPAMMVALLLYGYAVGLYSSRRIAKACMERVCLHFRWSCIGKCAGVPLSIVLQRAATTSWCCSTTALYLLGARRSPGRTIGSPTHRSCLCSRRCPERASSSTAQRPRRTPR